VRDCPFDLDTIRDHEWIAGVVYRETIESTSDLALELAAEGTHPPGPPLLVLAAEQTRGRGQPGRRWESTHGSLTFSLLMTHPTPVPLQKLPTLALATALGISRALSTRLAATPSVQADPAAQLKWPNDVVVGDRKICGVLVEARPATPQALPGVVVGVGVNVNNPIDPDLAEQATSLTRELGSHTPLTSCLLEILEEIPREFEAWRLEDPDLPERWNRACRDLDRRITIAAPGGEVEGTCRGIDRDGRLLLEGLDGSLQHLVSQVGQSARQPVEAPEQPVRPAASCHPERSEE